MIINPYLFGNFNEYSFLLDGVNEYFQISHNNAMNLSYNTETTIGGYFRWAALGTNSRLITKRSATGTNDGWEVQKDTSDRIVFILRNGANTEVLQVRTTSAVPLNTTDFYHIAIEKPTNSTAANTLIYVNNVSVAVTVVTDTMTSYVYANTTTLRIGHNVSGSTYYNGYITSPYMINKTLTAGERLEVYNSGKPTNIKNTSLSANLIFQLGTSTNTAQFTWNDVSGNGYDGTSFNMEDADKTTVIP